MPGTWPFSAGAEFAAREGEISADVQRAGHRQRQLDGQFGDIRRVDLQRAVAGGTWEVFHLFGQVDVRLNVHAVVALGDLSLLDLHPAVAEGDEAVDPVEGGLRRTLAA